MLRALAAALLMIAPVPAALAEDLAGLEALKAAMSGLYVVVPKNTETGEAVKDVRTDAEGGEPRSVVVAFLDAEAAASDIIEAGIGEKSEGGLINAADLMAATSGEVTWITSPANASLVNGQRDRPPVFYITNPADEPLTSVIGGEPKIVFYVDADAADAARVAAQNLLSASGQPMTLSVVAGDFEALIGGIQSGDVQGAHLASSPSVVRWVEQWQAGARLIKDYKPATVD